MTRPFVKIRCERGTGRDGRVLRLVGRKFTFGRDEGCSVPVESDLASRRHMQIVLEDGEWLVRDLGSSNGTTLNGERVLSAPVGPGDVMELGQDGPRVTMIEVWDGDVAGEDLEATDTSSPGARLELEPDPVKERAPAPPPPPSEPTSTSAVPLGRVRAAPSDSVHEPIITDKTPPPGFPFLAVIGLGLGVATAMAAWSDPFPYERVCAPVLWLVERLAREWPDWVARKAAWLVIVGLGLHGWLAGVWLRRPIRRVALLVVLAGLHVAAVMVRS